MRWFLAAPIKVAMRESNASSCRIGTEIALVFCSFLLSLEETSPYFFVDCVSTLLLKCHMSNDLVGALVEQLQDVEVSVIEKMSIVVGHGVHLWAERLMQEVMMMQEK